MKLKWEREMNSRKVACSPTHITQCYGGNFAPCQSFLYKLYKNKELSERVTIGLIYLSNKHITYKNIQRAYNNQRPQMGVCPASL